MRIQIENFWVKTACYPSPPQGSGGAAAHVFSSARSRKPVFSASGDSIDEVMAYARMWVGRQVASEPMPRSQATPESTEVVEEIVWELEPLLLPPAPEPEE